MVVLAQIEERPESLVVTRAERGSLERQRLFPELQGLVIAIENSVDACQEIPGQKRVAMTNAEPGLLARQRLFAQHECLIVVAEFQVAGGQEFGRTQPIRIVRTPTRFVELP